MVSTYMSSGSSASPAAVSARAWRWYDSTPAHVFALAALFTAAAVCEAHKLLALTNGDVWWHLRSGMWMLETHSVPRTGVFSQFSSLPWIDPSWGFDGMTAIAYRLFGLAGLPLLLMFLQVMVAVAFFVLGLSTSRKFWPAALLAAIAQCCLVPFQPRPSLCSMMLLALELALLIRVRTTG